MSARPWLSLVLPFACTAPPMPEPLELGDLRPALSTHAPEPPPGPPGPAQKLKLEISLKDGFAAFELGQRVVVTAKIRNISPEPLPIVLPGDGSDAGWRPPHVDFHGKIEGLAGATSLERRASLGRCGMFDTDWHDEIVTVPSGGEVSLGEWIPAPSDVLVMDRPGRIHFAMTYTYPAGTSVRDGDEPFKPGAMGETPAFTLTSNNLQIQRSESLALAVRPRAELPAGRATKMDHYYQLEVHNNTDAARSLPAITHAYLRFAPSAGDTEQYDYSTTFERPKGRTTPISVPPHASVVLPDLATFKFPYKQKWSDHDIDATLEVRLAGLDDNVYVEMDAFNHGYAR